jgi:hypothetical protein
VAHQSLGWGFRGAFYDQDLDLIEAWSFWGSRSPGVGRLQRRVANEVLGSLLLLASWRPSLAGAMTKGFGGACGPSVPGLGFPGCLLTTKIWI